MTWLLEDPTIIIAIGVLLELGLLVVLFVGGNRGMLLGMLVVLLLVGVGLLIEREVVTDREQIEELFDRMAVALQANDAEAALKAIDPAATRVQSDVRRALGIAKIDEVTITDLRITLSPHGQPNTAEADLSARVSGHERRGSTALQSYVGRYLIQLKKDQDHWLIESYQEKPLVGKKH